MNIEKSRATTPGRRFYKKIKNKTLKKSSVKCLIKSLHRKKGRNNQGRITVRHRGGGHKRLYRMIDFKRDKKEIKGIVCQIEYDPNRNANIALLNYEDGEKRYILCPKGLKEGNKVISSDKETNQQNVGDSYTLKNILLSSFIHSIELYPGKGATIARSAGMYAQLINIENRYATLKMPSGEIRNVLSNCRATIGIVGNEKYMNTSMGKAGRNRWRDRRPTVRGVAMNPVDHPMGGGEGKTSGGGHPVSPWGQISHGLVTRKRSKSTNRLIIKRRNGKKIKK